LLTTYGLHLTLEISFTLSSVTVLPAFALVWRVLGCLIAVPMAAACDVPNSAVLVMAVQLLGQSPLGTAHPAVRALARCIG
jgi:hypothetical protein